MKLEISKRDDRKKLLTWFFTDRGAVFEHRQVIELAKVSYSTMQNWANRGLVAPLDLTGAPRRLYPAKTLLTIAMAARLVDQRLTPAGAFMAAAVALEMMLYEYNASTATEENPLVSLDFRNFVALVHIVPEEVTGPLKSKARVHVGPIKKIFEQVDDDDPAYSMLKIGQIWFDLVLAAYEMKQAEAEVLRKSGKIEFDPFVNAVKRKRAS